jgi:hypothetical protein
MCDRAGRLVYSSFGRIKHRNFTNVTNRWVNPALEQLPDTTVDKLYEHYLKSLLAEPLNDNESNYNLAIFYKQQGIAIARRFQDRRKSGWEETVYSDFDKSFVHFSKVDDSYLSVDVDLINRELTRRQLYIFPDHFPHYPHIEQRTQNPVIYYTTDAFMAWVLDRGHLLELFQDISDLDQLEFWVFASRFGNYNWFWWLTGNNKVRTETYEKLNARMNEHPLRGDISLRGIKVGLSNRYFKEGKAELGVQVASELDPNQGGYWNFLKEVYGNLALHEEFSLASRIMSGVPDLDDQATLYDVAAIKCFLANKDSLGSQYLDSARQKFETITDPAGSYYIAHAYAIALEADVNAFDESRELASALFSFDRLALTYPILIRATSLNGRYYDAYELMPRYTDLDKLMAITQVLYGINYYRRDTTWLEYDQARDFTFQAF